MTAEQIHDALIEAHPQLEWQELDAGAIGYRNPNLPAYQEDPTLMTRITRSKFVTMTPDEIYHQINKGYDVEVITRITGYMSKKSGWNPGKLAELKDRVRFDLNTMSPCGLSGEDLADLEAKVKEGTINEEFSEIQQDSCALGLCQVMV